MSRNIKILSQQFGGIPKDHESSATTWGALKSEMQSVLGMDVSNIKGVESITKTEYSMNDAVLPTGDFILFTVAAKNKSGYDDDTIEGIADDVAACREELTALRQLVNNYLNLLKKSGMSGADQKLLEEFERINNMA